MALRWQAEDLLGAVIHEAYSVAEDIRDGTFTALPVAPDGMVYDDLIERPDGEDYMTADEMRRWLGEPEIE